MQQPYAIGLFGGSGVGKTTLAQSLASAIQPLQTTILSADHFYKPISEQVLDEEGQVNFDLPTALNEQGFHQAFNRLYAGNSVEIPIYSYNTGPTGIQHLHAHELLIVEGLYLAHYKDMRKRLNLLIYLSVDPAIQLNRKLRRDIQARGGDEQTVLYQWNNHCIPGEERYIKPYISEADFQIDTGDEHATTHLIQRIKTYLSERYSND